MPKDIVLSYQHPLFDIPIAVLVDLQELKSRLRRLDKVDVRRVHVDYPTWFGSGWYDGTPHGAFDGITRRENDNVR